MKHTIIFILLSLFVIACTGRQTDLRCGGGGGALAPKESKAIDLRCQKLKTEARKKGIKAGVCYNGPLTIGVDKGAEHPDPEACGALGDEAQKKCDDLPPAGPGDIDTVSGSATYRGKKPIMIDGKPVCP